MTLKPKRSLLMVLLLAFGLPLVVVFMVTLWGVSTHEGAMGRVMDSYVLNVAQGVADKIKALGTQPLRSRRLTIQLEQANLLSWGARLPGWVTVLDSSGDMVATSHEGNRPALTLPPSIVMNRSLRLQDKSGVQYSVAVCPTGGAESFYVVAVVRWDDLLGPMVRSNRLLGFYLLASFLTLVAVMVLLWRWVIHPLGVLADDVSRVRLDEACDLKESSSAVYEIRRLRRVICNLSRATKSKMDQWRNYSGDMVQIQENEKENFAREIHDGPVQTATALVQAIRYSRFDDLKEDEKKEKLQQAEEIGSSLVKELRALCDDMTPPWLDLGLNYALNELCNRMSSLQNVKIFLSCPEVTVPQSVVLTCYRLVQEVISNAVKHGQATEIDLTIEEMPDGWLVMKVTDNGKGFVVPEDLDDLRRGGHRGLLSMRDRMRVMDGTVEFASRPGEGTTITFVFPTQERQGEAKRGD